MPLHLSIDTEKPKFCLSLNKNRGVLVRSENKNNSNVKINRTDSFEESIFGESTEFKENKPVKRQIGDTYLKTLNAAKKLRLNKNKTQVLDKNRAKECQQENLLTEVMLNGHQGKDSEANGLSLNKKIPLSSLSNLGNTCFLNSVLYTLRFAPRFLHNLHHLVCDLSLVDQKLGSVRIKSSSLGRGTALLTPSSPHTWSAKDLLSLTNNDSSGNKSKIQVVTEQLHETFACMTNAEGKCSGNADLTPDPCAASAFLTALRDVNSTFEGNRQQDAHELLVCLLDCIRETCRALKTRNARLAINNPDSVCGVTRSESGKLSETGRGRAGLRKTWKRQRDPPPVPAPETGHDFVTEDFEGVTVLRTTCAECETVTERKQAMFDICVPICDGGGDASGTDERDPFRVACFASECLREQNKYWCECCLRYNEAWRTVSYERLPRLLVLHLKRFSGGMEKITTYHPTPLELDCFCESCAREDTRHTYSLWAIVVHSGRTLSGGHYVAYARASDVSDANCGRTVPAPRPAGLVRALLGAQRTSRPCAASTCCAPPRCDWLLCDDEVIKPITRERLEKLLTEERAASTPYLLFYAKDEDD